jgi:hypothetical protein
LAIPAVVQDELVVGEDVSPALRRIEVREANRRDALQAYELGCLDPAMSGDDLVIIADQHRIGEAELLNAIGNLPDLLLGMGTRIPCIGSQACDRQRFNDHGLHVLPLLLKAPIGKTESPQAPFGFASRAQRHTRLSLIWDEVNDYTTADRVAICRLSLFVGGNFRQDLVAGLAAGIS